MLNLLKELLQDRRRYFADPACIASHFVAFWTILACHSHWAWPRIQGWNWKESQRR